MKAGDLSCQKALVDRIFEISKFEPRSATFKEGELAELISEASELLEANRNSSTDGQDRLLLANLKVWLDQATALQESEATSGPTAEPVRLDIFGQRVPLIRKEYEYRNEIGVDFANKAVLDELITIYQNEGPRALQKKLKDPNLQVAKSIDTLVKQVKETKDELTKAIIDAIGRFGDSSRSRNIQGILRTRKDVFLEYVVENLNENVASGEAESRSALSRLEGEIASNPEIVRFGTGKAELDSFLKSEVGRFTPQEAFTPAFPEKFNKATELLFKEGVDALEDSVLKELEVENGNQPLTRRQLFNELVQEDVFRKKIVSLAQKKLNRESASARKRITSTKAQTKVDIVFIGAGVHEQIAQNYLRQNATYLKTLNR